MTSDYLHRSALLCEMFGKIPDALGFGHAKSSNPEQRHSKSALRRFPRLRLEVHTIPFQLLHTV